METRFFRCASCGTFNRVPAGRSGTPSCGRCRRSLDTSGAPQEVDEAELARAVAAAPVPVLVDFWAPWCGPCRMVAPTVDQVARARAGEVAVLKLDTEAHPAAGARHGIRGVPTFALFAGGSEVARRSGALPRHELEALLGQVPVGSVHP